MIEILFFFLGLCVPDAANETGYDCGWEIIPVKFQETMDYLYYVYRDELVDYPVDGLIVYHSKKVLVLYDRMTAWTPLGCTILWHEILHAWGYSEEDMPKCTWQPKSTKTTWQVIIP